MNLYLIRHTSVDVPQGVCYGQSDVPLKATFQAEADKVLSQLAQLEFDSAYTSPLSRCTKLAHYCGFANAWQDSRLQEINFGAWELKAWDEITDVNLQHWYNDWINVAATEGESFNDLYKRFSSFVNDLPNTVNNIVIFTHGGIINCARIYAGLTTPAKMFEDTPSYGSITHLIF